MLGTFIPSMGIHDPKDLSAAVLPAQTMPDFGT